MTLLCQSNNVIIPKTMQGREANVLDDQKPPVSPCPATKLVPQWKTSIIRSIPTMSPTAKSVKLDNAQGGIIGTPQAQRPDSQSVDLDRPESQSQSAHLPAAAPPRPRRRRHVPNSFSISPPTKIIAGTLRAHYSARRDERKTALAVELDREQRRNACLKDTLEIIKEEKRRLSAQLKHQNEENERIAQACRRLSERVVDKDCELGMLRFEVFSLRRMLENRKEAICTLEGQVGSLSERAATTAEDTYGDWLDDTIRTPLDRLSRHEVPPRICRRR